MAFKNYTNSNHSKNTATDRKKATRLEGGGEKRTRQQWALEDRWEIGSPGSGSGEGGERLEGGSGVKGEEPN